jgi:hypothetical protein
VKFMNVGSRWYESAENRMTRLTSLLVVPFQTLHEAINSWVDNPSDRESKAEKPLIDVLATAYVASIAEVIVEHALVVSIQVAKALASNNETPSQEEVSGAINQEFPPASHPRSIALPPQHPHSTLLLHHRPFSSSTGSALQVSQPCLGTDRGLRD